jgi:hypothetical protein
VLTNKQRLSKLLEAESWLKQTTRGYAPERPYWKRAMPALWEVRLSLRGTEDGDMLAEAHGFLKLTEHGYDPRAVNWREAFERIDFVEAGLAPPPVPYLGAVTPGGKAVNLQQLSHNTDGVHRLGQPSYYPAFDFGWVPGLAMLAVEPMRVRRQSSAMGADAFYAAGESGIDYWYGHLVRAPATGTRFKRGDVVARIAAIPGVDHGHLGINAIPVIGKDLSWGRYGRGPDYTWGSPTVGAQLQKALAL